MGSQFIDTCRQQSHLNFGATGVAGLTSVGLNYFSLDTGCNHMFSLNETRPAVLKGHKVPVELATAAGTATDVLSAKFLLFTEFLIVAHRQIED
jgi:hypothetical protein